MVINVADERRITHGGSLVICHHCWTIGHNLIKDDIHVYTLEITSDEYLIWLSLVYSSTRFTDNKVFLLHQRKHFL